MNRAAVRKVWLGTGTDRMGNGSYLVARKIRMEIESWDTDPLTDQERIFARNKTRGRR